MPLPATAPAAPIGTVNPAPAGAVSRLHLYLELAKPRISAMVLITCALGAKLGGEVAKASIATIGWTLLGTAISASGANALNQWWERAHDARMRRTAARPLPSGRLGGTSALLFGLALAVVGPLLLALLVNPLASALAAATLLTYVLVYTPLKRRTYWCTLVGAVPGALPPLIGFAGAAGTIGASMAAWLFLILLTWQLPHFYAIAWRYRRDYAEGGFPMLAVGDEGGRRTGRHGLAWQVLAVAASLGPVATGDASLSYGAAAAALGAVSLWTSIRLFQRCDDRRARTVFLWSVIELPLLIGALALDHLL